MASMAAAAYYQQLSMSLGGTPTGIPGGQLLQTKLGPNSAQIAAALASNPYLLHSLPPPPSSARGPSIFSSQALNQLSMQRYHAAHPLAPHHPPTSNDSSFDQLKANIHGNQLNSHEFSLAAISNLQNPLLTSNGDKFMSTAHDQHQVVNGNSNWRSNFEAFPTAWQMNQFYNLPKGNYYKLDIKEVRTLIRRLYISSFNPMR